MTADYCEIKTNSGRWLLTIGRSRHTPEDDDWPWRYMFKTIFIILREAEGVNDADWSIRSRTCSELSRRSIIDFSLLLLLLLLLLHSFFPSFFLSSFSFLSGTNKTNQKNKLKEEEIQGPVILKIQSTKGSPRHGVGLKIYIVASPASPAVYRAKLCCLISSSAFIFGVPGSCSDV